MSEAMRVLQIEDSTTDAKLVLQALRSPGATIEAERVEDPESLRAALEQKAWDIVISDWSMPKFSALAALEIVRSSGLDLPFIIVSGTIGEETAVEAMRAGAHDYVLKDKLGRLRPAVERELRERARREAHRTAEASLRRVEEQLRQAQKMEAIGSLAGGVAHDFNNILSVILSYSELILDGLDANDPLRGEVEQIRAAGKRAADLTRQLLTFSRQQVIEPKVLDLNTVLAGMDKMLRRILGEDIDLVSTMDSGLGTVRADPGLLEQVVMNLVVNARDAMPTGGKLTMETANVELDQEFALEHHAAKPGPYVMLAVTDTGTGMDRATRARIFEPFFTTKEKGKGTGLGLSTVFGIVQQSGGHVWVYSEPGNGTTFKIYLPRVDGVAEQLRRNTSAGNLRGSETILLVEDEVQVRTVARSILAKHGYHVFEAGNAGEALLVCENHPGPIHLLLTDVVMPQMSGPELAKRLATIRQDMKVLYMSGYADDAALRHGVVEAGIFYLQKPLTIETLTRRVREVLDSTRPR